MTVGEDAYRVQVELVGPDFARQTADCHFTFKLNAQDQADLRWYLEDYLQHPLDPAPQLAARIEARLAAIGAELFRAVFQSSDDTRDLWATLRSQLDATRIEVIAAVRETITIPWELLRDPKTDTPLALRAAAFVRTHPSPAQTPLLPRATAGEQVRILLVICRPRGGEDVPFRSVASRILKGLSDEARQAFQLDLLRPATFEALGKTLRAAKAAGKPYHIVHFDGHGLYTAAEHLQDLATLLHGLNAQMLAAPRTGRHGYLLFENPRLSTNADPVDGTTLGQLLAETNVPILVLNACRSAHSEALPSPDPSPSPGEGNSFTPGASSGVGDVHSQVRAFGSLAQAVMDAGVAGVVAMRYNVYVVTAAQFVADLYAALAGGQALGEAVTLGRKQLAAQPLREIAYQPLPLQDWPVPVVYEAAPLALFVPSSAPSLTIALEAADAAPERAQLDPELPKAPDVGFWGRDETLLALDRAFDTQPVVLFHAFAGSGKTATAAEFARWYALTGGVQGPVLFTSFEQYRPLPRVLDQLERMFRPALEQQGIHWLTLDDIQRRDVALQILRQIPVLWIWDNVEPVAGFPEGTSSAWSAAEQRELVDFLRDARGTRARFLLTSRRDERAWLGDLPARITLPPMPMQERVQMARALAQKYGRTLAAVDDWLPLLRYTQGNPLTITVVAGQALRDGLKTRDQLAAYVTRLRAGETTFEDEASEGRSRSLGASLSYGFAHAFSEDERRVLALLHFFQGFVDVQVLRWMGDPQIGDLPEVRGLTYEAGIALLDRAAEIGLLAARGSGYYTIHPALPWYFKSLFDQYYPEQLAVVSSRLDTPNSAFRTPQSIAMRAFVEAMGNLGTYYATKYAQGNRDVIAALTEEEANLLHARRLASRHGWWPLVISTIQAVKQLYDHTGRRAEWSTLVDEIVPDFVDRATDGPLPGREEEWDFITYYRVDLLFKARQWAKAERLQLAHLSWNRKRAAPLLASPLEMLDNTALNTIRSLAVSVEVLGHIQRQQRSPDCVAAYEEAANLFRHIGDRPAEAIVAFNLGHVYKTLPTRRDLGQAEHWYRRSLELTDRRDRQQQARCLRELGAVAFERFIEARTAQRSVEELAGHIATAANFTYQGLDLLPPDAVSDLAVMHGQLGTIYRNAGDQDRALSHHREALRYEEFQGDGYAAAQTRFNIALVLADTGRLADALAYAQAALRNYQTYGDRAAAAIQQTQGLIAAIEQAMRG
jgi:tetratricopeptide (TPR) repeat protein